MSMHTVIREKRRELGLTQEQVAGYLNVSAPAVNKWEKGMTSPDVSILPALARLLGIDMNTLFDFQENLSGQEVGCFANKVVEILGTQGFEAAFLTVKEKIQEYPSCDLLYSTMASLMDGGLLIAGVHPKDREKYEAVIDEWYEKAAKSQEEEIRSQALFMLAGRYLRRKNYEKAQEMIDLLPERVHVDKRTMQINLFMEQGQAEAAAELAQRCLLERVNEVQGILQRLTDIELAMENVEKAEEIAKICGKTVRLLGLWEYNSYVASLQVALKEQDVQRSIELLDKLLTAALLPWNLKDSPLYYRMKTKEDSTVVPKMLGQILLELKNDPEYEFLQEEEAFRALLKKHRERLGK